MKPKSQPRLPVKDDACTACGLKWTDHPGIQPTCTRRFELLGKLTISEIRREYIANKCFVRGVFLGIIAQELGITAEPPAIQKILKELRRLKKSDKKYAELNRMVFRRKTKKLTS